MDLPLDKLNILRSMDYETYFGEMQLSKEQIEERIRLARELEDLFVYCFAYIGISFDYEKALMDLQPKYRSLLIAYGLDEETANFFADWLPKEMIEATKRHEDDPWYLSYDRAAYNAEDQSNTILNKKDFLQAVSDGYSYKEWITILDGRERTTHMIADGTKIPITDFFEVGSALLFYPKDVVYGNGAEHPEEIVNCRCSVLYS